MSGWFVRAVEVRFRDVDVLGHAHHTLPLVYFEEARAAFWREVVGRPGIEGIDYLLAEATARYHDRIPYPARLDVAARVTRIGTKSFTMEYEARRDGALLASGQTVQVMYDYAAGRAKPIPDDVRATLAEFLNEAT